MAQTVHLKLKAGGSDVKGDSHIHSLDRDKTIECLKFWDGSTAARDPATGWSTGRYKFEPLTVIKRIDPATPFIAKALTQNQAVEGTFMFFRPNPETGEEEMFFCIEFAEGRISHIKRVSPDVTDPAAAMEPPTEEVGILFSKAKYLWCDGNLEHSVDWKGAG